jgi:peptide deformylase
LVLTNKLFERYNIECDKVSVEEGEEIAVKLLKELTNSKIGIGLAAPQIGITKRVCVINVKDPVVLINPEIIESEGEFIFKESCLSYPKKIVSVKRYTRIAVDASNLDEPLVFDIREKGTMQNILEIACIQHEIDHLDGITMFDRKHIKPTYRAPKKYGRNEKVVIVAKDNKSTKKIKYKKALPLINSGEWSIFEYKGQRSIPQ